MVRVGVHGVAGTMALFYLLELAVLRSLGVPGMNGAIPSPPAGLTASGSTRLSFQISRAKKALRTILLPNPSRICESSPFWPLSPDPAASTIGAQFVCLRR